MKYVPPRYGDPDDPYVDGNPDGSSEGSIPPAAAIEHPMREIEAAIVAAGLVPDSEDLTQLAAAIPALAGLAGFLRRTATDTLTAGFWAGRVTLDGSTGTATPVLAQGNVFDLDTNGAGAIDQTVTLAFPDPVPPGGMFIIEAAQDATGGHGLTLAAGYRVMQGAWSTDPGATNILWCTIGAGGGVIDVVIGQRGEA